MSSRLLLLVAVLTSSACGGATGTEGSGAGTTGGAGNGGTGGGTVSGGTGSGTGTGGSSFCELPPDSGSCDGYMPMFYFDAALGQCAEFVYGGCDGNANRFPSALACRDACGGVAPDFCFLPPDRGICDDYIPRYYFDSATGRCELFSYGGCEGNANRFAMETECLATCGDVARAQCPLRMPTGPCDPDGLSCPYDSLGGCLCIFHDTYWCEPVPACSSAADPIPAAGGTSGAAPAPATTTCTCSANSWRCLQLY